MRIPAGFLTAACLAAFLTATAGSPFPGASFGVLETDGSTCGLQYNCGGMLMDKQEYQQLSALVHAGQCTPQAHRHYEEASVWLCGSSVMPAYVVSNLQEGNCTDQPMPCRDGEIATMLAQNPAVPELHPIAAALTNHSRSFVSGPGSRNARYSWALGPWDGCNRACGGGVRHRTVECRQITPGLKTHLGSKYESVADGYCSSHKPSTQEACNTRSCNFCAEPDPCSNRGECVSADPQQKLPSRCVCEPGWGGKHCHLPLDNRAKPSDACGGRAVDINRRCCSGLLKDALGNCCKSEDLGLDGNGMCCGTTIDACGVCGGNSTVVDPTGHCCPAGWELDASLSCCHPDDIDKCGVCHGDGRSCSLRLKLGLWLASMDQRQAPQLALGSAISPLTGGSYSMLRRDTQELFDIALGSAVRSKFLEVHSVVPIQNGTAPGAPHSVTHQMVPMTEEDKQLLPYYVEFGVPPGGLAEGDVPPLFIYNNLNELATSIREAGAPGGGEGLSLIRHFVVGPVSFTGTCGNGVCEAGEQADSDMLDHCPEDCPSWSLPDDDTADHVACSGRGTWLAAGEGGCSCHTGYMGIDCKECWVGWERHPGLPATPCVPISIAAIEEDDMDDVEEEEDAEQVPVPKPQATLEPAAVDTPAAAAPEEAVNRGGSIDVPRAVSGVGGMEVDASNDEEKGGGFPIVIAGISIGLVILVCLLGLALLLMHVQERKRKSADGGAGSSRKLKRTHSQRTLSRKSSPMSDHKQKSKSLIQSLTDAVQKRLQGDSVPADTSVSTKLQFTTPTKSYSSRPSFDSLHATAGSTPPVRKHPSLRGLYPQTPMTSGFNLDMHHRESWGDAANHMYVQECSTPEPGLQACTALRPEDPWHPNVSPYRESELPMSSVGPSPAVLPQSPSTSYRTLKLFTTSSPELDEAAEAAQTAVPFRSPNNSNKSLKLYATASAGMDESVEPTMPYKSPTTSHKSLKLYDSASATIDEAAEVAEAERIRYRASVSPTPLSVDLSATGRSTGDSSSDQNTITPTFAVMDDMPSSPQSGALALRPRRKSNLGVASKLAVSDIRAAAEMDVSSPRDEEGFLSRSMEKPGVWPSGLRHKFAEDAGLMSKVPGFDRGSHANPRLHNTPADEDARPPNMVTKSLSSLPRHLRLGGEDSAASSDSEPSTPKYPAGSNFDSVVSRLMGGSDSRIHRTPSSPAAFDSTRKMRFMDMLKSPHVTPAKLGSNASSPGGKEEFGTPVARRNLTSFLEDNAPSQTPVDSPPVSQPSKPAQLTSHRLSDTEMKPAPAETFDVVLENSNDMTAQQMVEFLKSKGIRPDQIQLGGAPPAVMAATHDSNMATGDAFHTPPATGPLEDQEMRDHALASKGFGSFSATTMSSFSSTASSGPVFPPSEQSTPAGPAKQLSGSLQPGMFHSRSLGEMHTITEAAANSVHSLDSGRAVAEQAPHYRQYDVESSAGNTSDGQHPVPMAISSDDGEHDLPAGP